jgi:hypothetical protein
MATNTEELEKAYNQNVTNNTSSGDTGGSTATTDTATTTSSTTQSISGDAYSTARTDAINQMYDSQINQTKSELEAAYNQNVSDAQAAADKIAGTYQTQGNNLATQYERNRYNLNQQAAGNGINTGTGSQQALALASNYQSDYAGLNKSQAEAETEAEKGINDLTTQYRADIQSAIAQNDYQRAAALLDEYNNAEERNLQNAQILAQFGDFSGYATLYGQEQADNMLAIWQAQNPDLAYMTGSITKDQYNNLKNNLPINDGLDSNGNRIVTTSSGNNDGGSAYLNALNNWKYYSAANPNADVNEYFINALN